MLPLRCQATLGVGGKSERWFPGVRLGTGELGRKVDSTNFRWYRCTDKVLAGTANEDKRGGAEQTIWKALGTKGCSD